LIVAAPRVTILHPHQWRLLRRSNDRAAASSSLSGTVVSIGIGVGIGVVIAVADEEVGTSAATDATDAHTLAAPTTAAVAVAALQSHRGRLRTTLLSGGWRRRLHQPPR
jgi:hypothetical protein